MKRRPYLSVLAALPLLSLGLSACSAGEDGGRGEQQETDGATTGTAGPMTDEAESSGGTTSVADGDASETGEADSESSGTGTVDEPADLEALVAALCEWEFKCCSDGEVDYRLGPFAQDAADCTERFLQQVMSNDNDAHSPRADLLFVLGYSVDLERSEPDADNVAACAEQWQDQVCSQTFDGEPASCATAHPSDPCALSNLFTGKLAPGEECSEGLAGFADIECMPGATCEQVENGDWACVDKGLADDFCEADAACDDGLFCEISTGRCAEKGGVGEPCAFADPQEPNAGTESLPCKASLSCDPSRNTCAAYCAAGFDCADDSACPRGQSCIPHDIGEATYTYCAPRGDSNGDRCDTQPDCGAGYHCNGAACASDIGVEDACGSDDECEAGLYCAVTCRVVKNAGEDCAGDFECNPGTTVGCITTDGARQCRTSELAVGDECVPGERDGGNWRSAGLCEDLAADGSAQPVCHAGAPVAASCDEDPGTQSILRCATELYCDEGLCNVKADSGEACGDDQDLQCLNGNCVEIWEAEYCSDLPPVVAPDLVTCDGV